MIIEIIIGYGMLFVFIQFMIMIITETFFSKSSLSELSLPELSLPESSSSKSYNLDKIEKSLLAKLSNAKKIEKS
jgi:hypothetical protein